MPVDLQIISPASGARREFGLRGSFGMQLDETISPVVIAADPLNLSPFRIDPVHWFASFIQPAVPAVFPWLGVFIDQDIRAVLDGITFTNEDAVLQRFTIGQFASTPIPVINGSTYEGLSPGLNNTPVPIRAWTATTAGPGVSLQYDRIAVPVGQTVTWRPTEAVVLTLGNGVNQGFGVLGVGANTAIACSFFGRVWSFR